MKELILREERVARTRGIQSKGFLLHNNSIVREKERERRKSHGFLSDAPSKGPLLLSFESRAFLSEFSAKERTVRLGKNEEIFSSKPYKKHPKRVRINA